MKLVILLIFCIGALNRVTAYPVHVSPSQKLTRVIASPISPSQERAIEEIEQFVNEVQVQKEKAAQQEATWRDFTRLLDQLIESQAKKQKSYSNVETEGVSSFFDNLGNKFQEFGKRMRHAFRLNGK